MPPSASRSAPGRASSAPVNAPRAWPKNSLSASVSGTAAQLTGTNGARARAPERVDGARDDLLAGARLALDEHGRPGPGGGANERAHALRSPGSRRSARRRRPARSPRPRAPAARRRSDAARARSSALERDVVGGARLHRRDGGGRAGRARRPRRPGARSASAAMTSPRSARAAAAGPRTTTSARSASASAPGRAAGCGRPTQLGARARAQRVVRAGRRTARRRASSTRIRAGPPQVRARLGASDRRDNDCDRTTSARARYAAA